MERIIGVSGTNGSGKDTIGLVGQEFNYFFVSVTDIMREEAKRRGWQGDRKDLSNISNEWRQKFGMGVLVDKALEVLHLQTKAYKGLIVASLRHPGEVDRVH